MEHRQLAGSGLNVPVLALGTTTFGGHDSFSRALGGLAVREAQRLVDVAVRAQPAARALRERQPTLAAGSSRICIWATTTPPSKLAFARRPLLFGSSAWMAPS